MEEYALKPITLPIFISVFITVIAGGYACADVTGPGCLDWVAKVVSVEGNAEVQRAGKEQWLAIVSEDTLCPGDIIRVHERSRAAIYLHNETTLRLDERTMATFSGFEKPGTPLFELLKGAVHFFSRFPRSLKVITPFVNAAIKGTEFFVRVQTDQSFISIFEGEVMANNESGSLTLTRGQSAIAAAGKAPVMRLEVRPRDAVQWALYYPPVLDDYFLSLQDGKEMLWQAAIRKSVEYFRKGDLAKAFSSLQGHPEETDDPRFYTYRAGLLLSVGRVDAAREDIRRTLERHPFDARALALQSIIALVNNDKDQALALANKSVEADPQCAGARIALSYAQQARFELDNALLSAQQATVISPENSIAWARLSELWLSFGYLDRALDAARKASSLNPQLARSQTVLGFAFLTQIEIEDAKRTFERAVELDQGDPLPQLGLGLAIIRKGDLEEGRYHIEIAASLDPNNSLIRSYLGKIFYEEKRGQLAADQLAIAKELDPLDPTPWLYDAILKQTSNRPVEALNDIQKSIELNDNRAVYRSRLLLDEDLAARSVSLARIYSDLGFDQLALVEGWKSLRADPGNFSAHRFLADAYTAMPRHEIARVSELLKSQLLQPVNILPVQPRIGESGLFIPESAGFMNPSFNEYSPLFNANRLAFLASGIAGGNRTLGDEVVLSGVWGKWSFSAGQLYYQTNGDRVTNERKHELYNVFAQTNLSPKTSIQAELRSSDKKANGELSGNLNPLDFSTDEKDKVRTQTLRLGFHHAFAPNSSLIGSFMVQQENGNGEATYPLFESSANIQEEDHGTIGEVQHLFKSKSINIISGLGQFEGKKDICDNSFGEELNSSMDTRHTNLYVYSDINFPRNVTWSFGTSADFFKEFDTRTQLNPKIGVSWNPWPSSTLRMAAFRTMTRTLISKQTIEPTQVAGFNQFYDDQPGTDAGSTALPWTRNSHRAFLAAWNSPSESSVSLIQLPDPMS